uniref:Minor capsid protein P9 transmembrane helices domain-containing protein n=1 Tax=viral metagenome TaxID=1070528 RepID=A0A6C0KMY3_9ZZZZ
MSTPFWSNDPTIIFNKDNIFDLWPCQQMSFEAKLNSISRLVILLSILGFLFTRNWNLIIIGLITLAIIFTIYKLRKDKIVSSLVKKEGFSNNDSLNKSTTTFNPVTLETVLRKDFYPTTKKNPFGNVLLTDIMDTPDRKSAAPSFNPDVYDEIDSSVKKQTQMLNPGIINTNKQLYGDLKDNYDLDNSMMNFYSTANTRVCNDQGAYGQYLYGSMYSGKESTPEGAMMRVKDNYRYILI